VAERNGGGRTPTTRRPTAPARCSAGREAERRVAFVGDVCVCVFFF
jgi:hypothetical protein